MVIQSDNQAAGSNDVAQFDQHADTYDLDLNRGLSVSGEDRHYFARERVQWLQRCLQELDQQPRHAMDYGCGMGDTVSLLRETFSLDSALGLEVSPRSLELARSRNRTPRCEFREFKDYVPKGNIDLVYCNGVFHHVPLDQRDEVVDYIWCCLRPGGIFALWENNPWNPGTRYVMSRIPFDRDAIMLPSTESSMRLRKRGFQVLSIQYLFFFPRFLKVLRFAEPHLRRLPLGAQYQVLSRKPVNLNYE